MATYRCDYTTERQRDRGSGRGHGRIGSGQEEIDAFTKMLLKCDYVNDDGEFNEAEYYDKRRRINTDVDENNNKLEYYKTMWGNNKKSMYKLAANQYTCLLKNDVGKVCNVTYKVLENMKQHQRTDHFDIVWICRICGYFCSRKDILNKRSTHNGWKPSSKPRFCDISRKSFTQIFNLMAHL